MELFSAVVPLGRAAVRELGAGRMVAGGAVAAPTPPVPQATAKSELSQRHAEPVRTPGGRW